MTRVNRLLNRNIWDTVCDDPSCGEFKVELKPEIRKALLRIAYDFLESIDALVDQLAGAGVLPHRITPTQMLQTYVPRVYPLYRRGWFPRWRAALEGLARSGPFFPIGRQGLFLHCNMDHCVHIADEAVRHVNNGGSPQDWVDRCNEFLDLRVRD